MQKKCPPWKAPWPPGHDYRFLKQSPIGPCMQVRTGAREPTFYFMARFQDEFYPTIDKEDGSLPVLTMRN